MSKMIRLTVLIAVCMIGWILAIGTARGASRPAGDQAKIDSLLATIEASDAVFIRNGTEHPASKAAAHLRSKLLFAGGRVQTARDFISNLASRSSTTGKPYEIRTKDGIQQPLEKWLLAKLEEFEKRAVTPAPAH